ncbi:MAG TPA: phosphoribosylformylglycinamidine synthase subunit PurS [Polyangiaceae bacterium]|jgi:phosphoribosylformylglycinamidine synthase
MKATVTVRLKPEVLDPQGRAVQRALGSFGIQGVTDVRVGKLIEIELDHSLPPGEELDKRLRTMCDELLANPVIEDYEIRVEAGT